MKNNLKSIRMKEFMMSATEFSKMLGVKQSTYSQWENASNNPTLEKAYDIAKKLNRSVTEIWLED